MITWNINNCLFEKYLSVVLPCQDVSTRLIMYSGAEKIKFVSTGTVFNFFSHEVRGLASFL